MTNVVLLSVDSLRADHCSCYGYDRETTPNLDAIAGDGARFANAYSASSHTREAMPALLTGQHPHAAIDGNFHCTAPTLATLLGESHASGAFHSNPFLSRAYGFDRDFDAFSDDLYLGQHKLVALLQRAWDRLRGHHYARAETINERALGWIDSISSERPFFLWNHYMDVHGPYEPPAAYRYGAEAVSNDRAQELWYDSNENPEDITPAERETIVDLYDGEVSYTDAMVGELVEALEGRGLLDETLVVITSDHGDLFGEGGVYGHPRRLHEKLLHVPLIVTGPGVPATDVTAPASTLDVVPTVQRFAGDDPTPGPGVPLQDLWDDPETFRERHILAEAIDRDAGVRRYWAASLDATRSYDHPIGDATAEIPDADTPALARTLREYVAAAGAPDGEVTTDDDSDVAADRLEALGYK